jgi:hypothetical protein
MGQQEYIKPPHYVIERKDFESEIYNEQYQIDVTMFYDPISLHNSPRFFFLAKYKTGSTVVTSKAQSFICGIPGDAKVEIRIDPAIASWCRWSRQFLPVTAKSEEPDIGASTHGNGVASFKVKKRPENDVRYHHLYLNIELLVGTPSGGGTRWVDYNYDPDVINPRPPGRIESDEVLPSDHPSVRDIGAEIIVPAPPPRSQAQPMVLVPSL